MLGFGGTAGDLGGVAGSLLFITGCIPIVELLVFVKSLLLYEAGQDVWRLTTHLSGSNDLPLAAIAEGFGDGGDE